MCVSDGGLEGRDETGWTFHSGTQQNGADTSDCGFPARHGGGGALLEQMHQRRDGMAAV